jgi:hypothetical protein
MKARPTPGWSIASDKARPLQRQHRGRGDRAHVEVSALEQQVVEIADASRHDEGRYVPAAARRDDGAMHPAAMQEIEVVGRATMADELLASRQAADLERHIGECGTLRVRYQIQAGEAGVGKCIDGRLATQIAGTIDRSVNHE